MTPHRPPTAQAPRLRTARPAAAIVELGFLAPVLFALMLGMFEMSRALMVKQNLTAAARKGCRTGILHIYGNSDIQNDVNNVMSDCGFTTAQFNPPTVGAINITVTDPNGNTLSDALDAPAGSTVSVQVSIPVSSFKWVSAIYLTGNMLDSDTVVMMKQ